MGIYWKVPKLWKDETAFIIAGGPSVRHEDLNTLKGRRVIAVNSSYAAVPFADYVFFSDSRWFNHHAEKLGPEWDARLVTVNQRFEGRRFLRMRRVFPNADPRAGHLGPGLAPEQTSVVCNRTSLQGAMNLAYHLGASRQVLVGADMGRDPETGVTHHHELHPWRNKKGNATWDIQMEELALIVSPLRERGVAVVNTSMQSRIPDTWGWPKFPLASMV